MVNFKIAPFPQNNQIASCHLDALRGLAAFAVMLGHVRLALIKDTIDVPNLLPWQKIIYLLTSFGPPAVIIFFVMSGYLVGSSVIRTQMNDNWRWGNYFIARFSRIYTVLIPALIIGLAIDLSGSSLLPQSSIYHTPGYNVMFPEKVTDMITEKIFLLHLLNLQDIWCTTLGSNHPLWSLANEWWYYMLFPIVTSLIFRLTNIKKRNPLLIAVELTAIIAIMLLIGSEVLVLFPIWVIGALIGLIPRRDHTKIPALLMSAILIALLITLSAKVFGNYQQIISTYGVGLVTAMLIYFTTCIGTQVKSKKYKSVTQFFSKISFSMYAMHMPIVTLAAAIIIGPNKRLLPTPNGVALILILSTIVTAYSYITWNLFEKQTPKVKSLLLEIIKNKITPKSENLKK